MILPNLLQFMSNAHGFHNPANWQGLPPEFQSVVKKILTDRFWQAGISSGSRDDFYENVTKTKMTLEGLASSIRGAIRMVRESCYSILWCMSRLDVHFYGLEELPGPLAMALFENAHALSSHQMSILLNMTRYIIDDCPVPYRKHFLTPLLASLFAQVDNKVSGEWNELIEKGQISQGGEAQLAEEMKEESILRQLTYTAVLIVAGLLDPQRPGETTISSTHMLPHLALPEMQAAANQGEPTMREFILSSDVVLEPLILFCTHALRMRDSRCCGIIIRVFRSIVPEFQADRADIREFICREVLMAAIDVSPPSLPLYSDIYTNQPRVVTPRRLLRRRPKRPRPAHRHHMSPLLPDLPNAAEPPTFVAGHHGG
jgi:exportin-5